MAQNGYLSLITSGLAAARPVSPDPLLPSSLFYYATDSGVLSFWNGSSWSVMTVTGVQTGVVASGTQTLAAATQLNYATSIIATCAVAGNAAKLPPNPQVNQFISVVNNGAFAAGIFPGEATTAIDALAAGAAATLSAGKTAEFVCTAPGVWTSYAGGTHVA